MSKKQRAEDQLSPQQRQKVVDLWDAGYDLTDIGERFGISIDSIALITSEVNAKRRAAAKARDMITAGYRTFLQREIGRQIG